ncbi:hypothetical protein [Terrabacter sp. NPDC080008]|uniref:hypothetical protein n=1 Tax=Terrabacter sp. NPDC080008 TaxID=3155176 RepID=UPI00344F8341
MSALEPGSQHTTTFGVVAVNPDASTAHSTIDPVPTDLRVERRTWGGMCASGPCESRLTVVADGTWVLVVNGKRTTGTLAHQQVVALTYDLRVTQARVDQARKAHVLATGKADCAADHDGTSASYTWTMRGRSESVSSCDQRPMPAPVELDRIADSISH